MRTKIYLIGILLSIGSFSLIKAQTTHYINWEMSVGANASITIDEGDIIEWIHTDPGMYHDVSSTDPNAPGGFGSTLMEFGNTYSFMFNFPVVFDYECSLHPGAMFGTITVLAAGATCDPPTNLVLDNTTTTTATFSWTASASETEGYSWVVMNFGDNPETDIPAASGNVASGVTTSEATGLSPSTTYQFYVATQCDNDEESGFAGPLLFITDAETATCIPPTNPMADNVTTTTATFSWTASVDETEGYSWVVMNVGDDPETDIPVASGNVATGITTAEATGLMPETTYHFYVTTQCDNDEESAFAGPVIFTTDAEAVTCDMPTDLTLNDATTTTATFSWTASADETEGYSWAVMNVGDDPETDTPVASGNVATGITTAEATGLMPETTYHFYVTTQCDNDEESAFAGPVIFTTDAEAVTCDMPTDLTLDNATTTTATFSWTASADETEGYSWVVMNIGDDPETDTPVANGNVATGVTTAEATGLNPSSVYHFYVTTQCDNDENSGFAGPLVFTTQILGIGEYDSDAFRFYPNPSSGSLYIEAAEQIEYVSVFNTMGREVLNYKNTTQSGFIEMDLSELNSGTYFLLVISDGEAFVNKLIRN